MKKKKTNLKKLKLNKNVISNLEEGQVQGGTQVSVLVICPAPTLLNCPPQTLICPRTLDCPDTFLCPQTLNCPQTLDCPSINVGCGSWIDACPSALACPF